MVNEGNSMEKGQCFPQVMPQQLDIHLQKEQNRNECRHIPYFSYKSNSISQYKIQWGNIKENMGENLRIGDVFLDITTAYSMKGKLNKLNYMNIKNFGEKALVKGQAKD
jgi:hypothetical protein